MAIKRWGVTPDGMEIHLEDRYQGSCKVPMDIVVACYPVAKRDVRIRDIDGFHAISVRKNRPFRVELIFPSEDEALYVFECLAQGRSTIYGYLRYLIPGTMTREIFLYALDKGN